MLHFLTARKGPYSLVTAALLLLASAGAQELPSDPNLVQGKFDNGLAYVIRKHANPAGRFQAWLHIRAGALNETEAQNGVAHFLEHLGFNGTKHWAAGSLIPELNKLGMEFGAHTNAHTGLDETVFKLTVPGNSDELLGTAMTLLGDFANGMLLADSEIDHERGVIMEEKGSHLGPQQRISKKARRWMFAGSQLEKHDVIGTETVIKGAARKEFVDFWDTWYRPELMTLIVVGDVDAQKVMALAKPQLGAWKARADARAFAGSGLKPRAQSRSVVITDPEIPSMFNVQMMSTRPGRSVVRNEGEYFTRVIEGVGQAVFAQRLGDMVQKGEAPWMFAQAGSSAFVDVEQMSLMAVGQPDKWREITTTLMRELKRALDHGFTEQEIERVVTEMVTGAERAVKTEATQEAEAHIQRIVRGVGRRAVLISAAHRLALLKQLIGVDRAKVHAAFKASMGGSVFDIVAILPESKDNPTAEAVLEATTAALLVETEAVAKAGAVKSILATLPTPGREASRSSDEKLAVTTIEFESGLVMHHRKMTKPADTVIVSVSLPGGRLEETAANRGVTDVASLAGATSRLDSLQIRDAMVGKNVSVSMRGGGDTFGLAIQGSAEDLEAGLQLAHALMTDARIETSAFDNWKKGSLLQLEKKKTDLQAQFGEALSRISYGLDPRYRELSAEDIGKRSIKEAEAWLKKTFMGAPLEVAVVGDIELERAKSLVALYLASLPKAVRGFDCLDAKRKLELPKGRQREKVEVATVTDKAMVLVGFRGCDAGQTRDRHALHLCAKIMSDRMRVQVREERGLVYSIQATSQPGMTVPGTGLFYAVAPTDPAKAADLAKLLRSMMLELAAKGPLEEELMVARKQARKSLERAVDNPGFWVQKLAKLHYRGKTMADLHGILTVYDSLSVADLQEVAARFLTEVREVTVVAVPKAPAGGK